MGRPCPLVLPVRSLADIHSFAFARLLAAVSVFCGVLAFPIGQHSQGMGAVMILACIASGFESWYAVRTTRRARSRRRIRNRYARGDERLLFEIRSI